ncbi:MAG: beta-ketoacyl-ACP synthase II [Actinobacteria bacterium]|nr:beta-ketoacyl-ACP synthase II [Actinomycetota bacterium]
MPLGLCTVVGPSSDVNRATARAAAYCHSTYATARERDVTPNSDEIVITGLGAVTPVGMDAPSTWDALCAGRSGITTIDAFDPAGLPTRIAGQVRGFDPLRAMSPKQVRRSARFSQLAVAAAVECAADAGLLAESDTAEGTGGVDGTDHLAHVDPTRVGVVLNTAVGAMGEIADAARTFDGRGWRGLRSSFVPSVIPNMAACQVAIRLGAHGPVTAGAFACASGNAALIDAVGLIRTGAADVVIAGGTDASIVPLMFGGLSMMGALSTRNDDPAAASRPFDADRDGFVYGEGAVTFAVESLAHARRRGARVYARYLGGALTCDAFHVTAPDPNAAYAAAAIRRALDDAHLAPSDVDYICAHGTSTKANDRSETKAIHAALGPAARSVAISSPKSMTGHLIGAAGALSVLVACLAIRDGVVPPTINLTTPDPECDLDYVPGTSRAMTVDSALVNAFGFGGQNCVVALGR